MDKVLYVFNNKIMIINKDKDETIEMFYFRVEFIVNQIIKNKSDLEKYILLSQYLKYKYFYKCEYEDKEINKILNSYLTKKNIMH